MYVAIIIVALLQGGQTIYRESRYYPLPNLATCEAALKAALVEEQRPDRPVTTTVTKAACEPMG